MDVNTMKVRLTLEIDVDVDAFRAEYNTNETRTEIREIVKSTIDDAARMAYGHMPAVVRIRTAL